MKFEAIDPPRRFEVGFDERVEMRDCGRMMLEPDEQITFVTPLGGEYDVARKEWGFYATPSLNGRLPRFRLRPVLVRNRDGRYFVLLVESDLEPSFERYLQTERLTVVAWMDHEKTLACIAQECSDSERVE